MAGSEPVEKLEMVCSLLSSKSLKSPCLRSRMYSPFLPVTTVSTKTKRDSFLITTLLCGGSVEFCCDDCAASFCAASLGAASFGTASLGASTVGGAGTGAGGLSCSALSQRGESSSAIGSKITIQLSRFEIVVMFMATAPGLPKSIRNDYRAITRGHLRTFTVTNH